MSSNQNRFSDAFLNAKRLTGDPEADNFIQAVFGDAEKRQSLQFWIKSAKDNDDINTLAEQFPGTNILSQAKRLPVWANSHLMKSGSIFFSRHSAIIMSLLGLLSLPYCYTAANGARVLHLSERMRKDTTKRLFETALFVWEVMAPEAFTNKGKAFTAILKVRLMHAAVRYYTLQSGNWENTWGLPVNQEDMAGTNLSFSLIVTRGLRLMGFTISKEEQEAFLHLWNVIGFLTGLEAELIAENSKMAQQLDRLISKRQFCASLHGQELTKSLTDHILKVNKSNAADKDILGLMRYLLGKDVSDQLKIDVPELSAYKLSLMRTINLLKSFRPQGNHEQDYYKTYRSFREQKPA